MYNNLHITKQRSIFHTAGWLFADLLLALTIIFIAASAGGKPAHKIILSTTPTPTATPVPISTATPPPPQGLDPHPLVFSMNADPLQLGQPGTITQMKAQVEQQLSQSHNSNRRVGFVITLAGGINGVNHATSFNAILASIPAFQHSVFKNYHDLNNPTNEFDLEIYFIE